MKRISMFLSILIAAQVMLLGGLGQTAAYGEDKGGESIVVALSGQILSLDPQRSAGTPSECVRRHMYEGLVYADEKIRSTLCWPKNGLPLRTV